MDWEDVLDQIDEKDTWEIIEDLKEFDQNVHRAIGWYLHARVSRAVAFVVCVVPISV